MKHVWETEEVHTGFWWGRPDGKRPLGGPGRRLKDNIKIHLQELGCAGVEWITLAQNRDRWWAVVNPVMDLLVP
jgi:hypothetical protein